MSEALQLSVGGVLALGAWLLPRRVAKAGASNTPALLLDFLPVVLVGGFILIATSRPIFSGGLLISLGAGFALADHTKREVLREPVVFSEMSGLRHVFTHPQLYLPFAGPALVVGGAAATVALCIALLSFEPALWEPDPLLLLVYGGLVAAVICLISAVPTLGPLAAAL